MYQEIHPEKPVVAWLWSQLTAISVVVQISSDLLQMPTDCD
jgi:hypothetical protein